MYKTKTLLLACSLLPFLASCDGEQERHELTPDVSSIIIYADETLDSLCFYTFDSWTVTPQVDWISVDGDSHLDIKYDNSMRYLCKVFLNVKPNTTGKTRTGTVLVKSYDYSYSAPFVQLGLLRVTHPGFTADSYLDEQSGIPDVAHYELIDSAHWTTDSICFTVQNNWDLVFADETPEWLTLEKTAGVPGKYHVHLTLVPNLDTEEGRKTKLRLVSDKVSNEIIVRQLPAKKEEE
ncbi:MAG: BACON domain-containing protein [Bacteroidaceae bacterium]|nr:BACON domain-containing protein [Bacteroidaceae bacterium]